MISSLVLAAVLFESSYHGIDVTLSSKSDTVDPASSVFVDLKIVSPKDVEVVLPDLKQRVHGFSSAEDIAVEPYEDDNGFRVAEARWKLVPEPCAEVYKIAPFPVKTKSGKSFVAGPVYFKSPTVDETVSGEMRIKPEKDAPPFDWKRFWKPCLIVLGAIALLLILWLIVRYIVKILKKRRMTPLQRAMFELDRLVEKNLPQSGMFKDFYVELTLIVKLYIQRRYALKVSNLTTGEFCAAINGVPSFPDDALSGLMEFFSAADMIKFAGESASVDMAREALNSAKTFIVCDAVRGERK